jgi:hypothetical protein
VSKYLNLYINQGETYNKSLTAYNENNLALDLSGSTGYCYLKTSYYTDTYKEIQVSVTGGTGSFALFMSATASASLKPARYVYDVEFHYANGTVVRSYQGTALVDPEVTK